MAPTRLLVIVPEDRAERLAVQLTRPLKATNGQEFDSGQVAGFAPKSAISIVLNDCGKAWLHHDTQKDWAKAFAIAQVDSTEAMKLICGPFAVEIVALDEEMKSAAAAAEADKAAILADAEAAAKLAAEEAAASEMEIARVKREADFNATQVDATAATSASNADLGTEQLNQPDPAPTPPADAPPTKRGNRTPRGV